MFTFHDEILVQMCSVYGKTAYKPMTVKRPECLTMPGCMSCGLPMTKNPHPMAGKMSHLNYIGATWGCLPCAELRATSRQRMFVELGHWLEEEHERWNQIAPNPIQDTRCKMIKETLIKLNWLEEARRKEIANGMPSIAHEKEGSIQKLPAGMQIQQEDPITTGKIFDAMWNRLKRGTLEICQIQSALQSMILWRPDGDSARLYRFDFNRQDLTMYKSIDDFVNVVICNTWKLNGHGYDIEIPQAGD